MATDQSQQILDNLQQLLDAANQQLQQLKSLSRYHQQQESDDVDALSQWFKHFGLEKVADALQEAGLDEYEVVQSLDDDDIADLIKEAKLTKLKAKAFRIGVKAVKDGKYAPKEKEDPFAALRESRKDKKGYVKLESSDKTAKGGPPARTVIFVGETGAGKTTVINSMCNYLQCVNYDEPFRYKLIMESKNKDKTKSQTRDITTYHLRDLPAIPYALNIIDTPGFGDTDGPRQDRIVRHKFKELFESEDRIDAIYFVIKHSSEVLGPAQKYIFDMVLNLFGKDVKNNIFILFTFSDGAKPPALEAVNGSKVPYAAYYQINNSGFGLLEPGKTNRTHQLFFDLGMAQFKNIFHRLGQVTPVSTKMTRETLKERDQITNMLFSIGQYLKTALDEIDAMHETQEYIKRNKEKIEANKDFELKVQEKESAKSGEHREAK